MTEAVSTRAPDDDYAINVALTCFRDGVNDGDASAAIATVSEIFTWMRDGEPSYWGAEGRHAIQTWIRRMISLSAQVDYTPINTRIIGAFALASGWETIKLGGKSSQPHQTSYRYFQTWEKSPEGVWRTSAFICNQDVPPAMLPEKI